MFDYLVRAAVRGRVLVLMALVGILAYGAYAYREMPVDAFPDISPIMVPEFAQAHGMAPEESERLITYEGGRGRTAVLVKNYPQK